VSRFPQFLYGVNCDLVSNNTLAVASFDIFNQHRNINPVVNRCSDLVCLLQVASCQFALLSFCCHIFKYKRPAVYLQYESAYFPDAGRNKKSPVGCTGLLSAAGGLNSRMVMLLQLQKTDIPSENNGKNLLSISHNFW
jgi:hypothetical protein